MISISPAALHRYDLHDLSRDTFPEDIMNPRHRDHRRSFNLSGSLRALAIAGLLSAGWQAPVQAEPAALVPKPAKVEWQTGVCTLDADTKIVYAGKEAEAEAETLASLLRPATGLPLAVSAAESADKPGNSISLSLDAGLETALGKEGYRLSVEPQEIRIIAAAPAGLFYGGQTLRQLLPAAVFANTKQAGVRWDAPCCHIEDKPRFAWRGYMLDYSRHFFDVDYSKHLLDGMALHKLNVLHIHLSDDDGWRIEIRKYPKLTTIGAWRGTQCPLPNRPGETHTRYGGFLTQDQIREIVAYAARLHVNIMPEIDLPGHSLALCTAYPETSPLTENGAPKAQGQTGNVISPAKESNYAMIDDIMGELAALFPFDYIHIGGDEVNPNAWKDCPEIRAFLKREKIASPHDAQVYFTKRLEGILAKHHKQMIGWNEILNDELQRSTAIMSWTGVGPGYQAARTGFPVVMAPGPHCYFDMAYPQGYDEPPAHSWAGKIDVERCYAFDPLAEKGLTAEQSQKFLGVHACLWSEFVTPWKAKNGWLDLKTAGETADYKTYPRLCALAEMGWTPQTVQHYRVRPATRPAPHASEACRHHLPRTDAGRRGPRKLDRYSCCPIMGRKFATRWTAAIHSTRPRPLIGTAGQFKATPLNFGPGPSSTGCRGRCASVLGRKPPAARQRNRKLRALTNNLNNSL